MRKAILNNGDPELAVLARVIVHLTRWSSPVTTVGDRRRQIVVTSGAEGHSNNGDSELAVLARADCSFDTPGAASSDHCRRDRRRQIVGSRGAEGHSNNGDSDWVVLARQATAHLTRWSSFQ